MKMLTWKMNLFLIGIGWIHMGPSAFATPQIGGVSSASSTQQVHFTPAQIADFAARGNLEYLDNEALTSMMRRIKPHLERMTERMTSAGASYAELEQPLPGHSEAPPMEAIVLDGQDFSLLQRVQCGPLSVADSPSADPSVLTLAAPVASPLFCESRRSDRAQFCQCVAENSAAGNAPYTRMSLGQLTRFEQTLGRQAIYQENLRIQDSFSDVADKLTWAQTFAPLRGRHASISDLACFPGNFGRTIRTLLENNQCESSALERIEGVVRDYSAECQNPSKGCEGNRRFTPATNYNIGDFFDEGAEADFLGRRGLTGHADFADVIRAGAIRSRIPDQLCEYLVQALQNVESSTDVNIPDELSTMLFQNPFTRFYIKTRVWGFDGRGARDFLLELKKQPALSEGSINRGNVREAFLQFINEQFDKTVEDCQAVVTQFRGLCSSASQAQFALANYLFFTPATNEGLFEDIRPELQRAGMNEDSIRVGLDQLTCHISGGDFNGAFDAYSMSYLATTPTFQHFNVTSNADVASKRYESSLERHSIIKAREDSQGARALTSTALRSTGVEEVDDRLIPRRGQGQDSRTAGSGQSKDNNSNENQGSGIVSQARPTTAGTPTSSYTFGSHTLGFGTSQVGLNNSSSTTVSQSGPNNEEARMRARIDELRSLLDQRKKQLDEIVNNPAPAMEDPNTRLSESEKKKKADELRRQIGQIESDLAGEQERLADYLNRRGGSNGGGSFSFGGNPGEKANQSSGESGFSNIPGTQGESKSDGREEFIETLVQADNRKSSHVPLEGLDTEGLLKLGIIVAHSSTIEGVTDPDADFILSIEEDRYQQIMGSPGELAQMIRLVGARKLFVIQKDQTTKAAVVIHLDDGSLTFAYEGNHSGRSIASVREQLGEVGQPVVPEDRVQHEGLKQMGESIVTEEQQ